MSATPGFGLTNVHIDLRNGSAWIDVPILPPCRARHCGRRGVGSIACTTRECHIGFRRRAGAQPGTQHAPGGSNSWCGYPGERLNLSWLTLSRIDSQKRVARSSDMIYLLPFKLPSYRHAARETAAKYLVYNLKT